MNTITSESSATPSTSDLEEMREIFSLVDKDGGGTISSTELGDLLEIIGIQSSEEELDKMVKQMDANNSGEIDFEEFAAVMMRKVDPGYSNEEIKKSFKVIQCENGREKGKVHVDDLVQFLTNHGSQDESMGEFSEMRVRSLVSQLDTDQNGLIDYEEYVDMMMNW